MGASLLLRSASCCSTPPPFWTPLGQPYVLVALCCVFGCSPDEAARLFCQNKRAAWRNQSRQPMARTPTRPRPQIVGSHAGESCRSFPLTRSTRANGSNAGHLPCARMPPLRSTLESSHHYHLAQLKTTQTPSRRLTARRCATAPPRLLLPTWTSRTPKRLASSVPRSTPTS